MNSQTSNKLQKTNFRSETTKEDSKYKFYGFYNIKPCQIKVKKPDSTAQRNY